MPGSGTASQMTAALNVTRSAPGKPAMPVLAGQQVAATSVTASRGTPTPTGIIKQSRPGNDFSAGRSGLPDWSTPAPAVPLPCLPCFRCLACLSPLPGNAHTSHTRPTRAPGVCKGQYSCAHLHRAATKPASSQPRPIPPCLAQYPTASKPATSIAPATCQYPLQWPLQHPQASPRLCHAIQPYAQGRPA